MKKTAIGRLFAASPFLFMGPVAGTLIGCKLLLGESSDKAKHEQVAVPKPLVITTFTDLTQATAILGTGGTIWEGSARGLLKWDTAKGSATLLTASDGLPGNRVVALTLDAQSGLWVVTAGGVAHQQAKGWKSYPMPQVGEVAGITVTADGTPWVGGDKGLYRLGKKGTWEPYLGNTSVTALVGAGNDVWVGTRKNGLAHIVADKKGDRVEAYGPDQGADLEKVTALTATPSGVMAVGEGRSGQRIAFYDGFRFWSYRLDGMENKVEWLRRIGADALIGSGTSVWTLKRADAGGSPAGITMAPVTPGTPLPAATGLARNEPPQVVRSDDKPPAPAAVAAKPAAAPSGDGGAPPPAPEKTAEAPSPGWEVARWGASLPAGVSAVGPDGPSLYVGTRYSGVARVEPEGGALYRQNDLTQDGDKLYVACEQENDCWVETGLPHAYHFDGGGFEVAEIDSEGGSKMMALIAAPNGGPLALSHGQKDSSIRVAQEQGDKWLPILLRDLQVPAGVPDITFARFSGTRLWLGLRYIDADGDATDFGAAEIDLSKDDVKFHRTVGVMAQKSESVTWPLPNDLTTAYFRPGESWFGTRTGMVRVKGGETRVFGEADGVASESVHDFVDGPDKKLWAATAHGVAEWDERTWSYPAADDALHGKSTGLVKDKFGSVWAASTNGLFLCSPPDPNTAEKFSVIKIDAKRGLADDKIIDVSIDRYGRVWALTEKGLSLLVR